MNYRPATPVEVLIILNLKMKFMESVARIVFKSKHSFQLKDHFVLICCAFYRDHSMYRCGCDEVFANLPMGHVLLWL